MEHPFINNLEDMTLEQLGSKVSELHKKLNIAHRMGNGYLCDQIRMAIESYNGKYQQKMRALSALKAGDTDSFNDKIDIS
jgi:cellobiose-specific phosphotransferase system component IIA